MRATASDVGVDVLWQQYGNGRETGVCAFALLPDAIALRFHDGSVYLYTAERPGSQHVRAMRVLAERGAGLTTYVNRHVRDHFAGMLDARSTRAEG